MSELKVDFSTGELSGSKVVETLRTVKDLKGIFKSEESRESLDQNKTVYRVQTYFPVEEGLEGGLFWGSTFIEPGTVGDEYFMTKGHLHSKESRGEYYITVAGEGALILMDKDRHTWYEEMKPGTVHYIPGFTAHRVANTGSTTLSFLASWPSDAGHNYELIAEQGFGARLLNVEGVPTLVKGS
jgi:glucose-6-phosphate isomerase, archaeal